MGDAAAVLGPLVKAGVVPIVIGDMDSVPPMLVAPFDGHEDINVLQIDAHIDFRDEINGRRDGFSSPMRRVRDYACVHHLVQVGARSIGSARRQEVEAALKAGNRIVTAWDVHENGAKSIAHSLDLSRRWVVSLDCDGMDPSVAPGVGAIEPGGLTFMQTAILSLGIYSLITSMQYSGGNWPGLFAGVTIVMVPTVALYIFLSERMISGITMGGVK